MKYIVEYVAYIKDIQAKNPGKNGPHGEIDNKSAFISILPWSKLFLLRYGFSATNKTWQSLKYLIMQTLVRGHIRIEKGSTQVVPERGYHALELSEKSLRISSYLRGITTDRRCIYRDVY